MSETTSKRRLRTLSAWPLFAVLVAGYGCTRPDVIPSDSSAAQTQPHDAPFQDQGNETDSELVPGSEPATISGSAPTAPHPAPTNVPFHHVENLPAGTLVSVRLKTPVYASTSASETSFEAVVVEPVVVEGDTMIPKGANVTGRVESARTSNIRPNRGYVRLALQSVEVGDHRLPLKTASLFAREAPLGDDPISVIHLEKGRRLTFRLNETVSPSNQQAQLTR